MTILLGIGVPMSINFSISEKLGLWIISTQRIRF